MVSKVCVLFSSCFCTAVLHVCVFRVRSNMTAIQPFFVPRKIPYFGVLLTICPRRAFALCLSEQASLPASWSESTKQTLQHTEVDEEIDEREIHVVRCRHAHLLMRKDSS